MRKALKWLLILFLALLLGGAWYAYPQLKIGAGYAAKMACSCHYLQGRTLSDIHAQDLNFSVLPQLSLTKSDSPQSVTASFFGLVSQTAYWRGDGCTLHVNPNADLPALWNLPKRKSEPWPRYDTLPAELDTTAFARAADLAFEPLPGGGTRAFLVVHDGRLVYERYASGFGPDTLLLGWSMTKSVTNALIGLAVKEGVLNTEEQALFKEWEMDERRQISLEDLLQMNSGLDWNEAYGSVSDATTMLYRYADMGGYASAKPQDLAPAAFWEYSSGTTNILSKLLGERIGEDYQRILYDSLFAKVGMRSARVERDQSGHYVGSSYGWATAQDWARFGQLYLQDGMWNGERVLPEGWVDYSRQEAEGSDGIYGAQIWLQTEDATSAPADVYMFRGFQEQRIVIIPSRKLVVVRLGKNEEPALPLNRILQEVISAF